MDSSAMQSLFRRLILRQEKLGPAIPVLGSLALGIVAQQFLTPTPRLAWGALLSVAGLYLLVTFSSRQNLRHKIFFAILLAGFAGSYRVLPNDFWVPALFAFSALLFLWAVPPPPEAKDEPFSRTEAIALGSILLLGFGLLAYDLENIPPGVHGDEGEVGLQALAILQGQVRNLISVGWFDQPILGFLWPAISMVIFGDTLFGLRMNSVLVGIASLALTYVLVRHLFGRGVAVLTTLLMATGHLFIALNRMGLNITQTTLLETASIYFLFRGLRSQNASDWTMSGFFVGAGLYLYTPSRLAPFLVAIFLFLNGFIERGFWKKHAKGLAILFFVAVLVFLPQGLYFLDHPSQFLSRTQAAFLFSKPEITEHFTGAKDPVSALLVQARRLLGFFNFGVDQSGHYGYKGPMLDFTSGVFFVLGLVYSLVHFKDSRFLFLNLWFWMTIFVGGILTLPAPYAPRLVGMMPAVYILVGLGLHKTLMQISNSLPRLLSPPTLAVLTVAALATIAYSNYQIYFVDYIHSLDGWAQLEPATAVAKYIRERRDTHEFYLLGPPRLYLGHGTIRFMARNYQGMDVQDPEAFIPLPQLPTEDVAYILLPEYLDYLIDLRVYYPRGREQVYLRSDGAIWFVAYEVSRETILESPIGAIKNSG